MSSHPFAYHRNKLLLLLEAVGIWIFPALLILDNLPLVNIALCSQCRAGQASLLHIWDQQRWDYFVHTVIQQKRSSSCYLNSILWTAMQTSSSAAYPENIHTLCDKFFHYNHRNWSYRRRETNWELDKLFKPHIFSWLVFIYLSFIQASMHTCKIIGMLLKWHISSFSETSF